MTTKTILAGTITAAALALGAGAAYAATTGGGPATPAPATTHAVTTVQHTQPAAPRPGNTYNRHCGNGYRNRYGYQGSGTHTWHNGTWCCDRQR
jgi:hypothetical protein